MTLEKKDQEKAGKHGEGLREADAGKAGDHGEKAEKADAGKAGKHGEKAEKTDAGKAGDHGEKVGKADAGNAGSRSEKEARRARKRIVLTGGGTAGHVTPNIALLPKLREEGYEVHYIGSYDGIERQLIAEYGIPYYGISSGKLRRYFDWKNFTDPFKVLKGYWQASSLLKRLKPDVVFSKGGFVSVPVVLAARRRRVPSVIHESDMTPGLANRICIPFTSKVCVNFPETLLHIPEGKGAYTGTPIRQELFDGDRKRGLARCGLEDGKPVLMIIGGSLGAKAINDAVREILPDLLKDFQVIHLCGNGKAEESLRGTKGYAQFEYVKEELADLYAAADLVISRAGANAICEILALRKPNILIPLSASASRGDQILNAGSFQRQGYSYVLPEEELGRESLETAIREVCRDREKYVAVMGGSEASDAIGRIFGWIEKVQEA